MKEGDDRLFLSTGREEISRQKILALAEVAGDVNRATCCVQWAKNISPLPTKTSARRLPQWILLLHSSGGGDGLKLKKERKKERKRIQHENF